jgi:very-short-patch-repair endonuclease
MRRNHRPILVQHARTMRSAPTWGELILWQALRGSRLGVAFRRQAIIGSFIVDFVAPSRRLVVEVDGLYHGGRGRADGRRDRDLAELGYRVVRVSDEMVRSQLDQVVAVIMGALDQS